MPRRKILRVLLAEDNEVNQAVIEGMLEYAGHQVDTVSNGKKALKALKKAHYDLVIMDCLMPVMDGFDATRSIRGATSSAIDPTVPILAITALATPEDNRRCLEAGMSGYISKPLMARELYAWIDEHLGTDTASRDAGRRGPWQPGRAVTDTGKAIQTAQQADVTKRMSGVFIRDASHWRVELRTLFDADKLRELGALAHKIRGTADVLGYLELSVIAAELERSGKADDAGNAANFVNQMEEILIQLIDEINTGS